MTAGACRINGLTEGDGTDEAGDGADAGDPSLAWLFALAAPLADDTTGGVAGKPDESVAVGVGVPLGVCVGVVTGAGVGVGVGVGVVAGAGVGAATNVGELVAEGQSRGVGRGREGRGHRARALAGLRAGQAHGT